MAAGDLPAVAIVDAASRERAQRPIAVGRVDDEEALLFERLQLKPVVEMRAAHELEHEIGVAFGHVRQRGGDELVEEVAVAHSPVFEGLAETAVVLGGLAQRAAHDLWPAVGHLEHAQDVGVGERHAQGLGHVANAGGIEGEPFGVAQHGGSLRDETPHLKGHARTAWR